MEVSGQLHASATLPLKKNLRVQIGEEAVKNRNNLLPLQGMELQFIGL
jgi:hypothetical protein